ncbi:MAG: polysaccharide deacetylase family protein, partial [Armatimonadetes bacterium]|nr:polysaccharide deacetylase family protein [Armatimonadota bacterium]
MLLASSLLLLTVTAPPQLACYAQALELVPATGEVKVEVAPVYDARTWAFSARWDDSQMNNLEMRRHMAKFGLKGTFYLNGTDPAGKFGESYARQLTEGGFSIGGHGQTHRDLTTLPANEVFLEVMAVKMDRESQLDVPINSYAFAYGRYENKEQPAILEGVTESLRRAGYHHNVYTSFVRDNPHLAPGEFSTGLQVVPGDKAVDEAKFNENLDKAVTKWPEAYRKTSYCLFLGVHAWQQGEVWNDIDALYAKLGGRPDWWYCNQTEYAAYHRQRLYTRLELGEPAAVSRRLTVVRPEPSELGDLVPLTLLLSGVAEVRLNGQALPARTQGDRLVVNLPHAPDHQLPRRISQVALPELSATAVAVPDLPGLQVALNHEAGTRALVLQLTTAQPWAAAEVAFRLPPVYTTGVVKKELGPLPVGSSEVRIELPPEREGELWQRGPRL